MLREIPWKYGGMIWCLLIYGANFYHKPKLFLWNFSSANLHASLMYSSILPTLLDDHIFEKIYGFNFDSSGLLETDLLRFALVGLKIFDLYCESSFTFYRPALVWQILPGMLCFYREIQILETHRLISDEKYYSVIVSWYFSSRIILIMLNNNKYNSESEK